MSYNNTQFPSGIKKVFLDLNWTKSYTQQNDITSDSLSSVAASEEDDVWNDIYEWQKFSDFFF